eukprot:713348-Rhodomonas_salina.1
MKTSFHSLLLFLSQARKREEEGKGEREGQRERGERERGEREEGREREGERGRERPEGDALAYEVVGEVCGQHRQVQRLQGERERESERERKRGRERARERGKERESGKEREKLWVRLGTHRPQGLTFAWGLTSPGQRVPAPLRTSSRLPRELKNWQLPHHRPRGGRGGSWQNRGTVTDNVTKTDNVTMTKTEKGW